MGPWRPMAPPVAKLIAALQRKISIVSTMCVSTCSPRFSENINQVMHHKYCFIYSAKIRYCVYVQTLLYWILSFADNSGYNPQCFPRSCVYRCLQAFSLQTTSQGVFSTSSSIPGGGYSSLNGIRVLSLLWIICGHSAQFPVINNLGMTRLTATCLFSLQVIQLLTHSHTKLPVLQITTKTGSKQLRAALFMCLPSADLYFWLWTPFYC